MDKKALDKLKTAIEECIEEDKIIVIHLTSVKENLTCRFCFTPLEANISEKELYLSNDCEILNFHNIVDCCVLYDGGYSVGDDNGNYVIIDIL